MCFHKVLKDTKVLTFVSANETSSKFPSYNWNSENHLFLIQSQLSSLKSQWLGTRTEILFPLDWQYVNFCLLHFLHFRKGIKLVNEFIAFCESVGNAIFKHLKVVKMKKFFCGLGPKTYSGGDFQHPHTPRLNLQCLPQQTVPLQCQIVLFCSIGRIPLFPK